MMKALVRRVVGVGACVALVLGVVVGLQQPAVASGHASVSITPVEPRTTTSGVGVTYTLDVTCSVTGGCPNTTVSFDTTKITGNGSNTTFATWVALNTCSGVSRTATATTVTFNYGTLSTGLKSCTFTVTPPPNTTLHGAQITLTPTMGGTGFDSVTGNSVVLTVDLGPSAGHNARITKTGTAALASGADMSYTVTFTSAGPPQPPGAPCGGLRGNLDVTSLSITDVLPANFVYETHTKTGLPGTLVYDPDSKTFTYSDPTGSASCGSFTVNGKAAENLASNTEICNEASATVRYLDDFEHTLTSNKACARITSNKVPDNFMAKFVTSDAMQQLGQHRWSKDGGAYPYVYPGLPSADPAADPGGTFWDATSTDMWWTLRLVPSTANAGVEFEIIDPMPCMDDFKPADRTYDSRAPGDLCKDPAFIPTLITAAGFTATAADLITLVHPDGTTTTVAWSPSVPQGNPGGWVIPASAVVSEIRIPRFPGTANNPGRIDFRIDGHAASAAQGDVRMGNTATANAYAVGSTDPLVPTDTATAHALIASPNPGTNLWPQVRAIHPTQNTPCRAAVVFDRRDRGGYTNAIQIARAPSEAIYVDYLAPAGSTILSGVTNAFQFTKVQTIPFGTSFQQQAWGGPNFTSQAITATVDPDWKGTGRPLMSWVIPAGTITTPGYYIFTPTTAVTVDLGPGCAGTYKNDLTVGYGDDVVGCLAGDQLPNQVLPPRTARDLNVNSVGTDEYCGASFDLPIAATNPAYTVDKTVQGNLDGQPLSAGATGHVSPTGGTATYNVTFTNIGESNLTNPVMYDILPAVGDTQATTLNPRGSEFGVSLTGVGPLPAGVTVYYSTSTNPCRPEVLAINPGCVDDWTATQPADLSSVRALKFVYTGTVWVPTAPEGSTKSFTIPFTVSTPSVDPGKTAWNTVGVSVKAGNAPQGAAESSRTGLQTQVGPQITKATTSTGFAKAGDQVNYTFTVTNNTTVALTNVGVVDNLVDAPPNAVAPTVTCQSLSGPAGTCSGSTTTLAPGQVATFVATYTVTQADVDKGSVADRGTATGTPPTGGALSNTSGLVTVTGTRSAGLSLTKSVNPDSVSSTGPVAYSFLVENTGNVTLANVDINETAFSGTGTPPVATCPAGAASMAPGAKVTCTASYTVTSADLNAGSVTNTATATATPPFGPAVTSQPSSATLIAAPPPEPTANDDTATTQAGTPVTINVLANDTPPVGGGTIDPASVRLMDGANPVTTLTTPGVGTYTVNTTTGAITFTPAPGFAGVAPPVTYRITASNGATDTAQITVTVLVPPAANDDSVVTQTDKPVTFNPLANDTPPPGGTIDPTSVRLVDASGNLVMTLTTSAGTYTVNTTTGTITFTAASGFSGTAPAVTYRITASNGTTDTGQITVRVLAPPTAVNDTPSTTTNNAVTFDPLANDTPPPGETLDRTSVKLIDASGNLVTTLTTEAGTYTVNTTTGEITFTPKPRYTGEAPAVTYQVSASNGATATATITVTVVAPNAICLGPPPASRSGYNVVRAPAAGGDVLGTAGNDLIIGSANKDRIAGLGGDDIIFGMEGDDHLSGSTGNDILCGGLGIDELSGGDGADVLSGDDGNDSLTGGLGDDLLFGGANDDRLVGGDGTDSCDTGGQAADMAAGPPSCDRIIGVIP